MFLNIAIQMGVRCQKTGQGHPGKEQIYILDFSKAFKIAKTINGPISLQNNYWLKTVKH